MDVSIGAAASAAMQHDAGTLRLGQVLKVLRRHIVLIGVCAIVAASGAFLYARSLPKSYTATSSMAIEGDRIAIPELQGALRSDTAPDPMPFVRTEVQALQARSLVQGVINQMGLDNNPEFNPALRPPTLVQQVKSVVMSLIPGTPGSGPAPGPDESVLLSVEKALSIFQDNRSLVISVSFTAQDPRVAAEFLNRLVNDYIQSRANRRIKANQGADQTLVERIAVAKAGLDAIEQQMTDLRSRGDIVALRAGSVGQQQVEELASAAGKASVDRAQLEATWERAQALGKSGSADQVAGVLDSPTISRLRDQESQASARVADLSSRYGSSYPGVRSAVADLAAVRGQLNGEVSRIIASLGAQLKVARDKEADIQRQLATARTAGVAAENAGAQLDQLKQEAVTRRTLYQTLLQREQQTVAQPAEAETPDVRVLSAAVPPSMPSGPHTVMIMGTGGMSGAVLGCLLALLRLGSVEGFASPADVTRETGLPVLGTIPRALLRRNLAGRVVAAPSGPEAEALRAIRARLRFTGRTGSPRSVLFASTLGGNATGELAAAFARVAAADGERVLLVEASLGAPKLAALFAVQSDALERVLQGGMDWRDAAVADSRGTLDLLVTNRAVPGASALLAKVPLQNMLVEAQQCYQLVVLSGPGADQADTQTLASRVDSLVIVLDGRSGSTAARQAASRLSGRNTGVPTAVLVS